MIKKLLFISILFVGISNIGYSQVFCTPDANITGSGFHPDSLTNLVEGHVDSLYEELITMIIPVDTLVGNPPTFTIPIDSVIINSIDSLPASIQYLCGNTRCKTPGGQRGCISLFGVPGTSDIGIHHLKINATLYGRTMLGAIQYPYPITFYRLNITPYTGVTKAYASNEVVLFQNTPNPSSNTTAISFNSPTAEVFNFNIIDGLGNCVYTKTINAITGINTIQIDCSTYAKGVYTYRISNSKTTTSKRLLIN